ncbi:3'-5' exonuclease [Nitrosophilus alvini]|uniref:3'-5' exonuclease n=1 Tax=Nitrosophilus alvini TaxID=2714855 RepID=UPI00190AF4E5|nr:3'-5' exonuclease [Nitrosophilus alvini]
MNRLLKWWFRRRLKRKEFEFLFDKEVENEYVVIDTETTGLNIKKDEIISIAAIVIKDNRLLTSKAFYITLKPSVELKEENIKIHKLRYCDLKDGMEPEVAIERFLYFIKNRQLVGYFLEFDIAMLNKYVKRSIGVPLPNRQIEISGLYHDREQKIIPQGFIDLRFNTILEKLNIPKFSAHNAFNDAIMSGLAFLKLTN